MNTTKNVRQTTYGVGLAAILVAAFMLVQPMNSYSQVGAEGILVNNCTLATQPDDPIDMNTVVGTKTNTQSLDEYAKTIHREKQIFACEDLNNPSTIYIVEVAIFAEIIENMDQKKIIRKQAEVITCIKDQDGFVIECQKRTPTTQTIASSNCEEQFVAHPEEMNTVVDTDNTNIVKTIDAQKEVFLCDFSKKVDVIIFTELWENLDKLPGNPVFKRTVESLRCTMSTILAIVEACVYSNVALVVPP